MLAFLSHHLWFGQQLSHLSLTLPRRHRALPRQTCYDAQAGKVRPSATLDHHRSGGGESGLRGRGVGHQVIHHLGLDDQVGDGLLQFGCDGAALGELIL